MSVNEAEPGPYLVEHIREHLLRDRRVGELDIHVAVEGNRVFVTGHVSTQERHDAVSAALAEYLPDHEVQNETTVSVYPEAPGASVP